MQTGRRARHKPKNLCCQDEAIANTNRVHEYLNRAIATVANTGFQISISIGSVDRFDSLEGRKINPGQNLSRDTALYIGFDFEFWRAKCFGVVYY